MAARRKLATTLLGAVTTLLLAAAPWGIDVSGLSPEAAAAPASSGQDSAGSSGSSAGGNSSSGKSGSSSSDSGKDNAGDMERGGSSGKRGTALPGLNLGDDFGRRSNEHINPVTGTRVEINGSNVEVLHLDGIREEIMDGRYRMNDAQGRMIIERNATESDRARVRAMIR